MNSENNLRISIDNSLQIQALFSSSDIFWLRGYLEAVGYHECLKWAWRYRSRIEDFLFLRANRRNSYLKRHFPDKPAQTLFLYFALLSSDYASKAFRLFADFEREAFYNDELNERGEVVYLASNFFVSDILSSCLWPFEEYEPPKLTLEYPYPNSTEDK